MRPHLTGLRHGERGAAMTPADLTGGGPPKRSGGVAGSSAFMAAPCGICPPASAVRAALAPGEATGLGQLSGLPSAVDGLVYAVSYGAGRWLVRDQTMDQRFGLWFATGITPASTGCRRPCKQHCAHRRAAREICPASAQRHWQPARGAGYPHRNRRGSGAGRPTWLWSPSRSPERNRGHRRQKDNGQRNVRRHQVLHNVLLPLWTAVTAVLPCRLDRSDRHSRRYGQRRRAASA